MGAQVRASELPGTTADELSRVDGSKVHVRMIPSGSFDRLSEMFREQYPQTGSGSLRPESRVLGGPL